MKCLCLTTLWLCILPNLAFAGDDASGPIQYSVDLSKAFTAYAMSETDKEWSRSLAQKFKYSGPVVHFVRTSLPLVVDGATVEGEVYQSVEKPNIFYVFYVLNSDAILQLHTRWPYNPGVRGFSIHAPKSRNFIVALNFFAIGVPILSSSPVETGKVTWKGKKLNRLQLHPLRKKQQI